MQSHEHGFGKFRRTSWGAKEDCNWCMAYERDQEKAMKDAREDFKVNYAPLLETTVVDADGIIQDCSHNDTRTESGDCACGCRDFEVCTLCDEEVQKATNKIIGKDERPSSVSFSPTGREIAVFLLMFFLCLGLSINEVMKGDLAAARYEVRK